MRAVAEDLEGIIEQQLVYLKAASKAGQLTTDDWESVAHIARVVRTLAVHDVKSEMERAPDLDVKQIAEALRALADGKL